MGEEENFNINKLAGQGRLEEVRSLLATNPGLIAYEDGQGKTPLHFAARGGHLEVAKLLLSLGAKVYAKDREGNTPEDLAVEKDHEEMVLLLDRTPEARARVYLRWLRVFCFVVCAVLLYVLKGENYQGPWVKHLEIIGIASFVLLIVLRWASPAVAWIIKKPKI